MRKSRMESYSNVGKSWSVPEVQRGQLYDKATSDVLIGEVVTHVDDLNYTLTNETLPGHLFEYGTVTRSLVVTQDMISVRTVGVGVNTSQAARLANIAAGRYFPDILDPKIRADIAARQLRQDINKLFQ